MISYCYYYLVLLLILLLILILILIRILCFNIVVGALCCQVTELDKKIAKCDEEIRLNMLWVLCSGVLTSLSGSFVGLC